LLSCEDIGGRPSRRTPRRSSGACPSNDASQVDDGRVELEGSSLAGHMTWTGKLIESLGHHRGENCCVGVAGVFAEKGYSVLKKARARETERE